MAKKEKKRLQVVISEEQDALLTETAYELSSRERIFSKSEVVRLAIHNLAKEIKAGHAKLEELAASLDGDEEE